MAVQHLKQAAKTPESETATARGVVAEMLAAIERRGEPAVREYAAKLDGWQGEIVVTPEEVERRTRSRSASSASPSTPRSGGSRPGFTAAAAGTRG